MKNYGGYFDIDRKLEEIKSLEQEMTKPNFWDNKEESDKVISELTNLKNISSTISSIKEKLDSDNELIDSLEENDSDMLSIIEEELNSLKKDIDELSLNIYLSGPYDKNDCILEIHPGAGGTESCDWASMLYRMYTRYLEKEGYKISILDYQVGDEAGLKSVTILVKGTNAYGYLKNEKGVHRLVRLSPFDSNNRRHTSFASVDVTPEIEQNNEIDLDEKDLKIDVYRSTGAGGQGVNTTDSAVRITHLPTKIVVTCQNERSQIQNKEQALKVLKNKLLLLEIEKQEKELNKIKGNQANIDFGSQIRSYVMHPYSMVKDHRTNIETSNVEKVLDGDINLFIEENLKKEL